MSRMNNLRRLGGLVRRVFRALNELIRVNEQHDELLARIRAVCYLSENVRKY